jgi:hypothetical protein
MLKAISPSKVFVRPPQISILSHQNEAASWSPLNSNRHDVAPAVAQNFIDLARLSHNNLTLVIQRIAPPLDDDTAPNFLKGFFSNFINRSFFRVESLRDPKIELAGQIWLDEDSSIGPASRLIKEDDPASQVMLLRNSALSGYTELKDVAMCDSYLAPFSPEKIFPGGRRGFFPINQAAAEIRAANSLIYGAHIYGGVSISDSKIHRSFIDAEGDKLILRGVDLYETFIPRGFPVKEGERIKGLLEGQKKWTRSIEALSEKGLKDELDRRLPLMAQPEITNLAVALCVLSNSAARYKVELIAPLLGHFPEFLNVIVKLGKFQGNTWLLDAAISPK